MIDGLFHLAGLAYFFGLLLLAAGALRTINPFAALRRKPVARRRAAAMGIDQRRKQPCVASADSAAPAV